MSYLDTCIIIAYGFDKEPNHDKAVKVINVARTIGEFYASTFTLVELNCVLSRKIRRYKLPPGIEQITDERAKLRATTSYLLQILNITIPADDPRLIGLGGLKLFRKFLESIQLAPEIKLGTGDIIHLAYAKQLKNKGVVEHLITLDPEILKKKQNIEIATELKVLKIPVLQ